MKHLLSYVGVLAALTVMIISGYMNFRYGVIKYSGGVALDGYLFGALTAAFDVSKSIVPIFVAWAFANRRYLFSALGALYVIGCIAFSMTASTGFIAEKRDSYVASRTATTESYAAVTQQLDDARRRLSELGTASPSATVKAELAAKRQHRRWRTSEQCTNATAAKSRDFCAAYNRLLAELGTAEELEKQQAKVTTLVARTETLRQAGGMRQKDPQMNLLSGLTGIAGSQMDVFLILVMVLLLEFGSAFGLYFALQHGGFTTHHSKTITSNIAVAADLKTMDSAANVSYAMSSSVANHTTHHHVANDRPLMLEKPSPTHPASDGSADTSDDSAALQMVAQYSVTRLVPARNEGISLAQIYADYRQWALGKEQKPLSRPAFDKALSTVASEVKAIELVHMGRTKLLRHVAFKAQAEAA